VSDPSTRPLPAERTRIGEKRFLADLVDLRRHVQQQRAKLDRLASDAPEWDATALDVLEATAEQLDFEDSAATLRVYWARQRSVAVLGWFVGGDAVAALVFAILAGLETVSWPGWVSAVLLVAAAFWTGLSPAVARAAFGAGIAAAALVSAAALTAALVMTGALAWPWLLAPAALIGATAVVLRARPGHG
jgi:hypothetical protein